MRCGRMNDMLLHADLHIHSALSPCADNDMTPNNIVNMAWIKGLDVIAITDHNSAENIIAVQECANRLGVIMIPGMEVETSEEIHMLCLFPNVAAAVDLQQELYASLSKRQNRDDVFGEQWVMDAQDKRVRKVDHLLLTATALDLYSLTDQVSKAGGVAVPAHIDRQSYSILASLGTLPADLGCPWAEVSRDCDVALLHAQYPEVASYPLMRSSDAHHLGSILERVQPIYVEERSVHGVIDALRAGRKTV